MEKNKKSGNVFFAFGGGRESSDGVVFPKYIGVGSFKVLAVNPSKDEAEAIYGRELEKEPEYTSTDEKTGTAQIRIEFIVQTIPEKNNGIELITKVPFFLKNEARMNKDNTKVQVINKYGETTWVTIEDAQNKVVPESVASWFEGPYRPACVGEEELTSFLKIYMNIPNKSYKKKNGEVVVLENLSDAEARLDNIVSYFTGNVREVKELVKIQPNNRVQLVIGVKTTDDNKQYQDVFTKMPMRSNLTDYSKVDAAIKEAKDNGMYSKTEFSIAPLAEYKVEATSFSGTGAPASAAAPVVKPNFGAFFGGSTPTPGAGGAGSEDTPF